MKQNKLKVGDEVLWRNSWGREFPKKAIVKTITLHSSDEEVDEIDWSEVKDRNVIVYFSDNTYWVWAYQIEKLEVTNEH